MQSEKQPGLGVRGSNSDLENMSLISHCPREACWVTLGPLHLLTRTSFSAILGGGEKSMGSTGFWCGRVAGQHGSRETQDIPRSLLWVSWWASDMALGIQLIYWGREPLGHSCEKPVSKFHALHKAKYWHNNTGGGGIQKISKWAKYNRGFCHSFGWFWKVIHMILSGLLGSFFVKRSWFLHHRDCSQMGMLLWLNGFFAVNARDCWSQQGSFRQLQETLKNASAPGGHYIFRRPFVEKGKKGCLKTGQGRCFQGISQNSVSLFAKSKCNWKFPELLMDGRLLMD